MIDIHTHILPELDDGSRNVDESIVMLGMLSDQGVDTVVATPHFYIDKTNPRDFLQSRNESFQKLKKQIEGMEQRPGIALGAEVQFYNELSSLDGIEQFCLGESNYILVEMPFAPWNGYVYQTLNNLSASRRITPVIAHFERYLDFMNEKETVLKLKEAGALIQINCSFLTDRSGKRKALNLVKKGEISFLGSDCHNTTSRPPDMNEGAEVIRKKLGDNGFERIEYRENKLMQKMLIY
ncbi:MAG: hypothetical protein E7401_03745 [Ruminococcaceae bacterium]|nr:hypothetical protein [Oscillospiraceae bacterium]